jgi:hypothetical protein
VVDEDDLLFVLAETQDRFTLKESRGCFGAKRVWWFVYSTRVSWFFCAKRVSTVVYLLFYALKEFFWFFFVVFALKKSLRGYICSKTFSTEKTVISVK